MLIHAIVQQRKKFKIFCYIIYYFKKALPKSLIDYRVLIMKVNIIQRLLLLTWRGPRVEEE